MTHADAQRAALARFQNPSAEFRRLNPLGRTEKPEAAPVTPGGSGGSKSVARAMNKTEAAFARLLEIRKQAGEIVSYTFEGVTLRLADGCRYTPDFFIVEKLAPVTLSFAEVKGAHVWDDARVKFKVAREMFPWAEFVMMQCVKGEWTQIY